MRIITPINVTGPTTFSRASTATYTTKAGLLATAAINELRPYYLPTETHLMGVLLEAAATNMVSYSEQFDNAAWNKVASTILANTVVSPDGTTDAETLREDTTNAGHSVDGTSITFTSGVTYTCSVFGKMGAGTRGLCLRFSSSAFPGSSRTAFFSLSAGIVVSNEAGTTATIELIGNGWYRCTLTATANQTATISGMFIILTDATNNRIYTGDGASSVHIWGAQVEAGSKATSYIPTVASAVTRAADTMTGTGLAFSNVPETDYAQWSAGTYTLGTRRLFNRKVYEVIVASTTDQPDTGAALTVPSWLLIGSENRYKMFDNTISTQTAQATSIEAAVTPGGIVNAVAFFGLSGNKVTVTVDDLTEGVVYDTTKSLQDYTAIVDWYAYFFEDIVQRTDIVFLDLPSYGSATLGFTVEGVAAECGEVVFGRQKILGVSNYGTGISIQDYSIKSRDDFGNTIITQRAFSKRADYDVTVETAAVSAVQKALADIRTTPTVFVGEETKAETVIYGFYRSFSIVLSNPSVSDCTIEVEGLV